MFAVQKYTQTRIFPSFENNIIYRVCVIISSFHDRYVYEEIEVNRFRRDCRFIT